MGSRFEFKNYRATDFELMTSASQFTDDLVCTVAVADWVQQGCRDNLVEIVRYWCHKYPYAGYGGMFYKWLNTKVTPQSYNSWGNGSAMRVSPVGWAFETLEDPLVLVTIYHKPVMKSVRYISLTKAAKVLFPKR